MNLSPSIIEHWHSQYEDLQLSTDDFYKAIEATLKKKAFPDVTVERVTLHESSWISGKRVYLNVRRFEYEFVICGAPWQKLLFLMVCEAIPVIWRIA